MLGEHRQAEPGGDEAVAQRGRGEAQLLRLGGAGALDRVLVLPAGPQAREVVRRPLALAAAGPGHDRPVARAEELLELGLGLLERPGREVGGLGAELERLVAGDRAQPDARAAVERGADVLGPDVEVAGVVVVEGGADVLPVVGQRGRDLLLGREHDRGVLRGEVQEGVEAVDREQLGDVGTVLVVAQRGDLGQLPVLGGELGGGGDLERVGLPQAALGEGREPAQGLDLDVEEVDADRAVLRGRIEVEQAAADRELAAVVDLVDALVARGDEVAADLVEVEEVALAQGEGRRAQRRVRDLLRERDRRDDDHRRLVAAGGGVLAAEEGVEGGDAQADEVRRRGQVRLVGDPAARVEPHGPWVQPRPQVSGEVSRLAVVAGDDDGRAPRGQGAVDAVQDGRDEVRAQRGGHERPAALASELDPARVVGEVAEEGAQRHARARRGTARGGARSVPSRVAGRRAVPARPRRLRRRRRRRGRPAGRRGSVRRPRTAPRRRAPRSAPRCRRSRRGRCASRPTRRS